MKFSTKLGNLFSVDDSYSLAHCISSDFVLGKGIALEFNRLFNSKNYLNSSKLDLKGLYPNCVRQKVIGRNVYHLVTKNKYYMKPTYETLKESLLKMKEIIIENNEKKIAMPKIGCGLDQLEWVKVREIICEVFNDIDVEIVVFLNGVEQ